MTKEDKQLLLKDISARLSYGVICDCLHDYHATASAVDAHDLTVYYYDCDEWEPIEYCKPYLRPMSSMTEEEMRELNCLCYHNIDVQDGMLYGYVCGDEMNDVIDWLNKNKFDYRGLIPKGLAIEVNESNNPYKIL